MTRFIPAVGSALLLLGAATLPLVAISDDKAPMPQTKGMQGMDPKVHDQKAEDPHKNCTPNADKAAQQAAHPMVETKGMKGMDPKSHKMDCPEPEVAKPDPNKPPKHEHKAPGG